MIGKEEVPEGKQANASLESLKSNESSSSAIAKTDKMAPDTKQGTYPHISASENVQKDTGNKASPHVPASKFVQNILHYNLCRLTIYKGNLNTHLEGKKHKDAYEALNTKTEGTAGTDTGNRASPHVSASTNVRKIWTCDICELTLYGSHLNSHLQGRRHKAAYEALNTKTKGTVVADTGSETSPQVSGSKNEQTKWICDICQMLMVSEANFKSHMKGKKHKAACELLNTKTKGTVGTDTGNRASPHVSASTNVRRTWTCGVCQLTMSAGNMNSHLKGKKHKAICKA